jgi:alkylation response protein AidB-like acyl-CoA dehydrogenase
MTNSFYPLFPGLLLDSAARYAQNQTSSPLAGDPKHNLRDLREMGWVCTLVPEEFGGVGGTIADLSAIIEGLATHGVQLPMVEAYAIAPLLLQAAPNNIAACWLSALCDGSATIVALTSLSSPLDAITVAVRRLNGGYELNGKILGVDYSLEASHYLVPARFEKTGELAIFLLERERFSAPTTFFRTIEGRHAADFTLASLSASPSDCISQGNTAAIALNRANNAALMLTAVDTVAAIAALIEQTVAHLTDRRQFGVALASFQALRHRSADMYVRYLAARGLVHHAFGEYERAAPDLARTLQLMKISLAESARTCAEAAIQMHGGMGMSEEVKATRLAQRLLASEFRYGDRLLYTARLLAPDQGVTP